MNNTVRLPILLGAVFCWLGVTGCALPAADGDEGGAGSGADPYYITGSAERREILEDLFTLLERERLPGESRFSVVQEIANEFARQKEFRRLINFLTSWINTHPDDPYAAYYCLMTAYGYIQLEAYPVAALYFDLILKNYPDLQVKGESIHYIALKQLITLVHDQGQLAWYYEELTTRFFEKIDQGASFFMLGQAYERTGEWNKAIEAYTNVLGYYDTAVPGFPDAYSYAKRLADFNNSSKDWTFESLSVLIQTIEECLDTGNSARLWRYRAKVNFFARTWGQDAEDAGMAEFNLGYFMGGNRIHYALRLDTASNANEAYLRTWGWSEYVSTWYFCFRKIYFPLNPDIHGRWEWAGIYYGEKF